MTNVAANDVAQANRRRLETLWRWLRAFTILSFGEGSHADEVEVLLRAWFRSSPVTPFGFSAMLE
ncbi:MAG: hypothetical protein IPM54_33395 [Polyangiaceae bacterium]|nr:hypothetical protein [Polyangiaceae bacterium]